MRAAHELEEVQPPADPCSCDCAICMPERWVPAARGRLSSGLSVVGDYPSLLQPPHFAPTVLLLDTCAIQHLSWVRTRGPFLNDDRGWRHVSRTYGPAMMQELKALSGLLCPVEQATERPSLWVVGRSSWQELSQAPLHRRTQLLEEWQFWRKRATCFSEGLDIDPELEPWLPFCSAPEENGWVHPEQDPLPGLDIGAPPIHEFGLFSDAGDRELIQEALSLGVPGILTTDLKSFWRHRCWLFDRGVEVWRPSHLSWALLDEALLFGRSAEIIPAWPMTISREDFPDFPEVKVA
jgi:hypothetical protein